MSKDPNIFESLREGEYYIWTAHFEDGNSAKVRASDYTTTQDIENHFAKKGQKVVKVDYNWGIQGGDHGMSRTDRNDYHKAQDEIAKITGQNTINFKEDFEISAPPGPGEVIRTKKSDMEGKVEKIEGSVVFFRIQDGRLMKTSLGNVTVVDKLADDDVSEVYEGVQYFYEDWKYKATELNSSEFNNTLLVSSGPNSILYQQDDGTIIAEWDKRNNKGYIREAMNGINRAAPAQDVSYEKVLDEVMARYTEELTELSVSSLDKYRKTAASPEAMQTRPLRKTAKSVAGVRNASDKIDAATGNRGGSNPKTGPINSKHTRVESYENRLSGMLGEDDSEELANMVKQQHAADQKQAQEKRKVVPIDYHGWTIKYRAAGQPGDKVDWVIYDKKSNLVKKGDATSDKDAVTQAQGFINDGGGTKKEASANVTIDFNANFAKEFSPGNDSVYVSFDKDGNVPQLIVSMAPQDGFKKTHIRNQKHTMTATTTGLPVVTLSAKESNALGLQPNGRYMLGDKDPIDDNTSMFPLIYQGTVQGSGDKMRMGKPGLTVAHSREINELYQGPWQGDPEKYAKAPKGTMMGSVDNTLSAKVQDSVKTHGVKWAFNYYVKKNGMPPRHFLIYSGI